MRGKKRDERRKKDKRQKERKETDRANRGIGFARLVKRRRKGTMHGMKEIECIPAHECLGEVENAEEMGSFRKQGGRYRPYTSELSTRKLP